MSISLVDAAKLAFWEIRTAARSVRAAAAPFASTATDLVTGKVVALGREYDGPTPANTFVYAALKPYVNPGNAGWQLRLSGKSRPSRHHRSTPSGRDDASRRFGKVET